MNLAVLHLANHMMDNEDMYGFLSYGDKDTFVSPPFRRQTRSFRYIDLSERGLTISDSHSTPLDYIISNPQRSLLLQVDIRLRVVNPP